MNSTALRIKRGMEYVCVTRANDHGSLCPDWGIDRGRGLSRVWGEGVLRWDFGSQKVPVPEAISIALSSCAIDRSRIALAAGIETGMPGHTLSLSLRRGDEIRHSKQVRRCDATEFTGFEDSTHHPIPVGRSELLTSGTFYLTYIDTSGCWGEGLRRATKKFHLRTVNFGCIDVPVSTHRSEDRVQEGPDSIHQPRVSTNPRKRFQDRILKIRRMTEGHWTRCCMLHIIRVVLFKTPRG
jgi:hypothetical protein